MERRTRFPVLMALLAAGLALSMVAAACGGDEPAAAPQEPAVSAQPVAPAEPAMEEKPYFEGKTIRVIANFPPGGGADMHARLTARHLPRFIEGSPRTVVVSKVGVGGDVGRNYVYAIKPDGLTIGSFSGTDPMRQLLADSAQWEADKWGMLLSFRKSQLRGWYIRGDGAYSNLKEAIGQGSAGGPRFTVAADTICSSVSLRKRAIIEWLDLPMDITFGLPGSRTNVMTHLERDDVDSQASTMWFTITRDRPGWMADGFIKGFAFPAGHASAEGPNAGTTPITARRAQTASPSSSTCWTTRTRRRCTTSSRRTTVLFSASSSRLPESTRTCSSSFRMPPSRWPTIAEFQNGLWAVLPRRAGNADPRDRSVGGQR